MAFIPDYQSQTKELEKRDAALGADAVTVSYSSEQTGYFGGTVATGHYGGTAGSRIAVGEAILYVDGMKTTH
jgi:hypothetical protein